MKGTPSAPGRLLATDAERITRAERLALTWFERQLRQNFDPPTHVDTPGWDIEEERRHGLPRFDERVELLRTTLEGLASRGVRLSIVLATLRRSKRAQFEHVQSGATLDASRTLAVVVAQIQRHLDKAADLMATVHTALNPEHLPVTQQLATAAEQRVRDGVRDDVLLRRYLSGRFRRARAGREARPWVRSARRQLARLGVRPHERDNLLEAVGLLTYAP